MPFQHNFLIDAAAESFGFYPKAQGSGYSFLKGSDTVAGQAYGRARTSGLGRMAALREGAGAGATAAKSMGAWGSFKAAGAMAARTLPALMTGYMMYEGYQTGGVIGVAGAAAESVAYTAAFNVGAAALGSVGVGIAAGAAIMAGGTYMAMKAGKQHMRGLRNVEMGGSGLGAIGSMGAATMRQRAAGALKNTHINGRMALGNEALLFHTNA